MMLNCKAVATLVAAIGVLFVGTTTLRAVDIVYQDNFDGDNSGLNGRTPNVTLNSNTWAAGPNIHRNGTLGAGTPGFSAFLPFSPQPDTVYTLSANLNALSTTAGNNNWLALGFSQTQSGLGVRWSDAPGTPIAWALSRSNQPTAGTLDTSFLGFGATP